MHQTNADQRIGRSERLFAQRMRERREDQGLSQARLASLLTEKVGLKLDPSAITRIEKNAEDPQGGRTIRLEEAVLIASVLRFSLDGLIEPDVTERIRVLEAEVKRAQTAHAVARERADKARADVAHAERILYEATSALDTLKRQIEEADERDDLVHRLAALDAAIADATAAVERFTGITHATEDQHESAHHEQDIRDAQLRLYALQADRVRIVGRLGKLS